MVCDLPPMHILDAPEVHFVSNKFSRTNPGPGWGIRGAGGMDFSKSVDGDNEKSRMQEPALAQLVKMTCFLSNIGRLAALEGY